MSWELKRFFAQQGVSKKSRQFWIGPQFHKSVHTMKFSVCMDWFGSWNVEKLKIFENYKFSKAGGLSIFAPLKEACAQKLQVLIVFWVNVPRVHYLLFSWSKFWRISSTTSSQKSHRHFSFYATHEVITHYIFQIGVICILPSPE